MRHAARSLVLVLTSSLAVPGHARSQEICCREAALGIATDYRVAGLEDRRFDHATYA